MEATTAHIIVTDTEQVDKNLTDSITRSFPFFHRMLQLQSS